MSEQKKTDDAPPAVPKKPPTDVYTKFCKYLDAIKGRDKLSKIVQYGSRSAKHYLLAADPKSEWGHRFDGLYSTTATGRKLFRMGKSLNEIETLRNLLTKGDENDPIKYYLSIVKQFAYMSYWFFDNIGYLIRAKFSRVDKKSTGLYASYGWFVGSVCGLLLALYDFQKVTAKLVNKIKQYKEAKQAARDGASDASNALKRDVLALGVKRMKAVEDIARFWLDCIVSGTSAELPQRVGLTAPHDGIIGLMGATSAAINAYQIWRDDK